MREYLTTYILALTLVIGELHTFWEKGEQQVANWIIAREVPMTIQWNVKLASDQLNYLLYFVAMYWYADNKNIVNRTTVISFLFLCVIDAAMYFYNYKTYGFGGVYIWLAVIWSLVYVAQGITNKRLGKRSHKI